MVDSKRLRQVIKSKGLKLKYVAEQLDITPFSLTQKIDNVTDFKIGEVGRMCDILEIDDLQEKEDIFFTH